MRTMFKRYLLFVLLAVFVAACGDDGVDGLDGVNGLDGKDGKNGQDGATLDPMTRDGYIKLSLQGKVKDQAFQENLIFPYADVDEFNMLTYSMRVERQQRIDYHIQRFAAPSLAGQNVSVDLAFAKPDLTLTEGEVSLSHMTIVVNNQAVYLSIGGQEATVTDFKYDAATGKVTFRFSGAVAKEKNVTGNDVVFSGEVNATVYTLK